MYFLLDPTDQSFGVKSKEKRACWAGVDKKIGAKMCYKLVDGETGKIINRLVICSATEPGTTNLRVDPIKPLLPDAIHSTASKKWSKVNKLSIKKTSNNVIFIPINPSLLKTTNIDTQQDLKPW